MQKQMPGKSALLALILVIAFLASWELYLRNKGYKPDFDDSPELWANTRAMVYEPSDKTTVFIGSSRIKYDLDIPTWEKLTGTQAVQLAMPGSTPRPMFDDLANDPKFKGKLVVDVTEILFFSPLPYFLVSPNAGINYYKNRTPSQKASFWLDKKLESRFVLLNSEFFSINGMMDHLTIQDRPGVYPFLNFPFDFEPTMYNRQSKMTDHFLVDTNEQNQVKAVWAMLGKAHLPAITGKDLDAVMSAVKDDVDKIKARGGDVIFVRTPSNPPMYIGEKMGFPRNLYWDRLLAVTGCKGIYFSDYPGMANLVCTEWSHLSPPNAVLYTQSLVDVLSKEKGWSFNATKQ